MKKLLVIVLAIPVLLAGCSTGCIEDSGIRTAKGITVKPFNKIDAGGAFKLVLRQDSTYGIKIEADSAIIENVKAEVSGSELRIKMKEGSYCGSDSIVVYAGIGELKQLSASGAMNVVSNGVINTKDLLMNFAGATDVSLSINAGKLITGIEGVGKLRLSGQAGVHELSTQGTAEVDAFNFLAGIYDVHVTGSGKANINVLNELKVETEGSSEIYYKGNPKKVNEKKAGATKLEKVN
ncbi:MAG: DUF2807 domain-containing protein [Pedobacter sp.]|nr:MAG: DUF2807 domain-containing protein [Pedobacter sp.]